MGDSRNLGFRPTSKANLERLPCQHATPWLDLRDERTRARVCVGRYMRYAFRTGIATQWWTYYGTALTDALGLCVALVKTGVSVGSR